MIAYALSGTPKQAEYATIIATHLIDEELSLEILDEIVVNLSLDDPNIMARLISLSELACFKPDSFDAHHSAILEFIVQKIIMEKESEKDEWNEWIEFNELKSAGQLKVISIRILVNRLLHGHIDTQSPFIVKTLNLVRKILRSNGDIRQDGSISPTVQMHMKYECAIAMLKFSKFKWFLSMIDNQDFVHLALVMQDPNYVIRNRFLEKLTESLLIKSCPFYYTVIIALAALDPERELREQAKRFLTRFSRDKRTGLFD